MKRLLIILSMAGILFGCATVRQPTPIKVESIDIEESPIILKGMATVESELGIARFVKGDTLKKLRKLLDQLIIVIPRNGLPPLHRLSNPWNTDSQMSGQFCEGRERGEALTWGIFGHLISHV